jgi:AtzE family amidohydrolase
MSAPLYALGATEIAAAVRGRRLSAEAVLESVLGRLETIGGALNAFRVVLVERGRREAKAVDDMIAAGRDPGPLAGVPYGVKDLFDVAGLPTAAGSKIGAEGPPALRDAVLVARLQAAGAVLFGVQVMDEYAYGFTTENIHYGAVHNPHDRERSAGGSSGGSAASVAAGLGAFSIASDTNGSIRVPSSFCGIFGLKPTFGRLPRTGSFPFVFDLDHLGPLARSVEDLALVYNVLQGHDPGDPACIPRPSEPVQAVPNAELRAGVLDGWFEEMAGPEALAAAARVADALSAQAKVTLQGAETARSAAFLITAASGANLHRANLAARPQDFDPATRGRLLAGALLPAGDILQAQRVRRRFYNEALDAFSRFEVLIAPATPCPATLLNQATIRIGGQDMPTRANLGVMTQPLSAIGLPVLTVPIRREGQLPIGVQLIAPPWREDLVFQAAAYLQQAGLASAAAIVPCA